MLIDITLIKETFSKDSKLKDIATTTERTIPVEVRSVTRQEFFLANKAGISPEYIAEIFFEDFEGETKAKIGNDEYKIYRSFTDYEEEKTELYLERVRKSGNS